MRLLLSTVVLTTLSASAAAQSFTSTQTGGLIPDATGSGVSVVPGERIMVFSFPNIGAVQSVELTLDNLLHTFAGDVSITLRSPDLFELPIITRPGRVGGSGLGDDSDFAGDYRFIDGGQDVVAGLAALPFNQPLPSGDYSAFSGSASASQALNISLNQFFRNRQLAGFWRLRITDNFPLESGRIDGATLTIHVPEPASLTALAGLALLTLRRRH